MIRPANIDDAEQAIPLLYSAIGKIAYTLTGTSNHSEAMRILTDFFRQQGNRISYENTTIEERDGQVAGMLVSYHGSRAEALDEPFVTRIRAETGVTDYTITKEPRSDEYYLDSIAVHDGYQGQGIGKALMQAFEEKARKEGYSKLSLIVEQENDRAFALYRKMGYQEDGTLMVSGSLFWRMVKIV